jgi:hypothetical protein
MDFFELCLFFELDEVATRLVMKHPAFPRSTYTDATGDEHFDPAAIMAFARGRDVYRLAESYARAEPKVK